jgi:hypothetical protein
MKSLLLREIEKYKLPKIKTAKLNNNGNPLIFQSIPIHLNELDPLDQRIEVNRFTPLDEWFCPICGERMCIRNDENMEIGELHFNETHKLDKFNFDNMYQFLLYGIA